LESTVNRLPGWLKTRSMYEEHVKMDEVAFIQRKSFKQGGHFIRVSEYEQISSQV